MIDHPRGEISIQLPQDACGLYFFVGRQATGSVDGTLEITLSTETKPILCKKIATLNHDWNLYYHDLPKDLPQSSNGGIKVSWSLDKPGRRVFVTSPLIKRSGKTRTLIVLIADAVRPKDMGIYAGNGNTPHSDKYFSKGLAFENSYSQSNWTLPTFASMSLSRYASDHHVVDPDIYSRAMDRSCPTLAELLRENGFYTYASISHRRCNHTLGHHRGFDHFDYSQTAVSPYGKMDQQGPNNMYRQSLKTLCHEVF